MKTPISATIEKDLIRWLDELVQNNSIYRNKSHVIEMAIQRYKSELTQEKAGKKR